MIDIVIIPCSGRKKNTIQLAKDLYIGPYYKLAKQAALALRPMQWFILSAKYGIVNPNQQIGPYDLLMGSPGSVTEEKMMEQAQEFRIANKENVVLICPSRYTQPLLSIWPNAQTPLKGVGGIGFQFAKMKEIAKTGIL